MTRLQLLNDPVFQSAPPTACFFYVGIRYGEYACIGIGDFNRDFSNKYEACFLQGAPNITKEELDKALQVTPKSKYRGRKIKVVEVQSNGGNGYFIWYDGYHYRFVSSFVFAPLNLRKKRVILYCKKTYGLKKKGSK